jgi:hypothetical protein
MVLHIVTYVTHSERYFNILKDYPGLVVLGYGTHWNGLIDKVRGVIKYCSTLNPDDLVLFVDGFDSVILSSTDEILSKYNTHFSNKLVFSKAITPKNTLFKYGQDKFFGRCKGISLNTGLYIGKASVLIDFWNDMNNNEDDQKYATTKCSKDYPDLVIDTTNILFYNYSHLDSINFINNKLIINDNSPCIISSPGTGNMNEVLSQLGFNNLPDDIIFNFYYRFKTYLKNFIPELLLLVVSILILIFNKTKINSWVLILILLIEVIHYELYVKFHDISNLNKVAYCLLDIIHMGFFIFLFLIIFKFKFDIKNLIIINILVLLFVTSFFIFKRCILTKIENKVLGVSEDIGSVSREIRVKYFFDISSKYEPGNSKDLNHTIAWINSNTIIFIIVLVLNVYYIIKLVGKGN